MDDRVTKKRAPRACLHCRNRKVRCDVVTGGHPCTNCRLDSLTCKVAESVRTRKPAPITSISRSPPQRSVEHSRASNSPGDQFPVSLTFDDQMDVSQTGGGLDENYHSSPAQSAAMDSSQGSTGSHLQHLPAYIKPLAAHISADDMEYLAKKDALTIPEDELRDELIKHYIKLVHPFMPILDVDEFVTPILRADGSSPVSLLLFQAVMFVSVSFVDINILRCRGYLCRKSTRKRFFGRVRLLYGLDCEPNRLALLQSLLFMTYWYDTPEDEKDTWHWMGISLSLAQVMGIHRNPESLRISPKAKRHRIRLWWSCLMRDRLLGLGIRRPARVRPDDFNVPMLTLDHFNMGPVSDEVAMLLGQSALALNVDTQRTLSIMCIELAKLCTCIGHVLLSQYSVLASHSTSSEYFSSVMVFPRKTAEQDSEAAKCDEELGEWYRSLDPCSLYTPYTANSVQGQDEADQIIRLHQMSLRMIYLTTLGVLHKPQTFRRASDIAAGGTTDNISRQKVTEAAIEMTQLAYDMQLHNQLRYLSTSSIPAFVSAALIHLFEIRSTQEDVRNISIGRFFQCMQVLRQLQDMYASADYAVYFLESVIQNTGIQVPMLSFTHSHNSQRRPQLNGRAFPMPVTLNAPYSSHAEATQKPYPTPSSFGTRPAPTGSPPMPSHGTGTSLVGPTAPSQALPLDAGGGTHDGLFSQEDASAAGPQSNNWNEVDHLLCAFINFDSDAGFSMSPTYTANG
ncbi:hypothetical protein FE257_004010 [Aspergillus nanangensis]|uniref:Zn(2)-C6 fungal-type domain-containing protein n=1 Tax=Aspergillus nanangensis TaxID=2582783 RepID=A0AAD4CTK4_ASPNN|nr:hypothetical protein FE257_004010 [Aspergillus nanangensis]